MQAGKNLLATLLLCRGKFEQADTAANLPGQSARLGRDACQQQPMCHDPGQFAGLFDLPTPATDCTANSGCNTKELRLLVLCRLHCLLHGLNLDLHGTMQGLLGVTSPELGHLTH